MNGTPPLSVQALQGWLYPTYICHGMALLSQACMHWQKCNGNSQVDWLAFPGSGVHMCSSSRLSRKNAALQQSVPMSNITSCLDVMSASAKAAILTSTREERSLKPSTQLRNDLPLPITLFLHAQTAAANLSCIS